MWGQGCYFDPKEKTADKLLAVFAERFRKLINNNMWINNKHG